MGWTGLSKRREEENYSDIAQALSILVDYARDKGQIYSAWDYAVLTIIPLLAKYKCRKYSVSEDVCEKKFGVFKDLAETALKVSPHEIAIYQTVWQKALDIITKINSKTEVVTQMVKGKRVE
jgi:hypothetical protein